MRLAFAAVLLHYSPLMWPFGADFSWQPAASARFSTMPEPHGLGQHLDLTVLAEPAVFRIFHGAFLAGVLLYAAGWLMPLALLVMLAVNVSVGTLQASQGFIGHSAQPVALVLLAQFLAATFAALSGPGWRGWVLSPARSLRLMADWSRQALAAVYLVTALTKLLISEGRWFTKGAEFVMQMEKSQTEALTDTGVGVSQSARRFTEWLGDHPSAASALLLAALLLEIAAPLALLNRSLSLIIGLLLILFHVVNDWLMSLPFAENRWLLLIFFVNIPFWAVTLLRRGSGVLPGTGHPHSPEAGPPAASTA